MLSTAFKPIGLFVRLIVYLVLAWGLGFGLFFLRLPSPVAVNEVSADAIVVLTGGSGRLDAGITLLQQGAAKRLLISGVHRDVLKKELSTLTGAAPALFDCCIDLDYAAGNTLGNAEETSSWVKKHGFKKLILVTADYHLQRSSILFRRALPDVEIKPYPVAVKVGLPMLAREYTKYLITLIQEAISPAAKGLK